MRDAKPIIVDIETCAHECAADYVPKPDLDAIQAAGNLKDPIKIKESIEKRRLEATEEYENSLRRAALDWNLSRIVALAWSDGDDVTVYLCPSEADEREALVKFWFRVRKASELIGFCARTFDAPTLIQRSRLLKVDYPHVNLARFGKGNVTDLRDLLTFDDARYEAIMPRSLKAFCKRFGIEVNDEIDGADIPALVNQGEWGKVRAHVESDVQLTVALARAIGVLLPETPEQPMSKEQEAVGF